MELLFVYGTLLQSFENEVLLALKPHLKIYGAGTIKGEIYDLGDYPGYIENPKGNHVVGEVYQLQNADEVLTVLDEYEGDEYVRKRKYVQVNGQNVKCWIYIYKFKPGAEHKKIINGDYIAFVRNKVNNG